MSKLICPDCGGTIKKTQLKCLHCGAELVRKTLSKEITPKKHNKVILSIQNNPVLLWLTIMSWLILPIIGGLIGGQYGAISLLIISIPISIVGLFLFIRPIKVILEDTTDNLKESNNSLWIIFFTIFFLGGLFKFLLPWLKNLNRNDVFVGMIGIGYIVFKLLQRPIYIGLGLYLLYRLVRFIKRAWNHDK